MDSNSSVADELAIRNLIARLARAADESPDLATDYALFFTENALWEAQGFGSSEGRAAILAGAEERRGAGTSGPGSNTRHVVSTTSIEVAGDEAHGLSVFQFYAQTDAQPVLSMMGTYEDRFRRTADGWQIAHRVTRRP